jgi:hypothetical protein
VDIECNVWIKIGKKQRGGENAKNTDRRWKLRGQKIEDRPLGR